MSRIQYTGQTVAAFMSLDDIHIKYTYDIEPDLLTVCPDLCLTITKL